MEDPRLSLLRSIKSRIDSGSDLVRRAVERDSAGDYGASLQLYLEGIEQLLMALREIKTKEKELERWWTRENIQTLRGNISSYLTRAEALKSIVNSGGSRP